jgi:hypothetical protein
MDMDCIQIIMMTATIATVIITAWALGSTLKQFKKQLQLNFFADYTKRYQEIVLNFPENINEPDFTFDEIDEETKEKTLRYMRIYFDLCSEEYYLSKKGHIHEDTWKEWKSGIEYAFSKKAFKDGWEIISLDTIYYKDFADLVDGFLNKSKQ